jgi:hypothetical protein
MLRRILRVTAVPDAVVIHQFLPRLQKRTPIHVLDQADGVDTLFAKARLAGAE